VYNLSRYLRIVFLARWRCVLEREFLLSFSDTNSVQISNCPGTTILAEYSLPTVSGNFPMVTRKILEKIPPENSKMSYAYDRYDPLA
jgi:hypothetical protein